MRMTKKSAPEAMRNRWIVILLCRLNSAMISSCSARISVSKKQTELRPAPRTLLVEKLYWLVGVRIPADPFNRALHHARHDDFPAKI